MTHKLGSPHGHGHYHISQSTDMLANFGQERCESDICEVIGSTSLTWMWLLCTAVISKPTVFFSSVRTPEQTQLPFLYLQSPFIGSGPRQTSFQVSRLSSKAGLSEPFLNILFIQPSLLLPFSKFIGQRYRFFLNCFIASYTYLTHYCEGKCCVLGSRKANVHDTEHSAE